MGWNPFASKEVTQVGTSTVRIIEDNAIPSSAKTGLIKALFNEGDMSEYMMEERVGSLGNRAERFYAYGRDHYTYGLPSGSIHSSSDGRQQVEAVIETLEGRQVTLDYCHYGPANALHIGWMKLISQHGYNPATNALTITVNGQPKQVYLDDLVVVVPASQQNTTDPKIIEQWGLPAKGGYTPFDEVPAAVLQFLNPSLPVIDSSATRVFVRAEVVWKEVDIEGYAIKHSEFFDIQVNDYPVDEGYFHAKYTVAGTPKYWMYRHGAGTYPTIDAVFTATPAVTGNYFPFTYFRFDKHAIDTNTDAYHTSKKMTHLLGMDFDVVAEGVNSNPDIGDVEQAMMVFGLPSVSTNPLECRYLFDFFDNLFYEQDGGTFWGSEWIQAMFNDEPTKSNTIIIQDKKFKMALTNAGITKRLVAGTIGEVGSYAALYGEETYLYKYTYWEGGTTTAEATIKVHKYRHQVAPGLYDEILVRDLQMKYWVYGGYTTTADETDDILLIPIDRSLMDTWSIPDKEVLYARSMHMVFNSRVVTKVKWYQTGVFKVVLFIVSVIITIINPPAGLAALELTGAALVVAAVIYVAVVGYLLQQVYSVFVKVVGAKAAEVIAILMIIYTGYKFVADGMKASWAINMLQTASNLYTTAIRFEIQDLLGEYADFQKSAQEQLKTLESIQDSLYYDRSIAPIVVFGESPDRFYNRTIHSGNVGVAGITAISSFVDIALTLPKVNDTLGERNYEWLS